MPARVYYFPREKRDFETTTWYSRYSRWSVTRNGIQWKRINSLPPPPLLLSFCSNPRSIRDACKVETTTSLWSTKQTYRQRSNEIGATWLEWWRFDIRRVPGLSPAPTLCKVSIQTTRYFGLCFVCEALGTADRSCRYTLLPLKCEYLCVSPRIPLQTEFQNCDNRGRIEHRHPAGFEQTRIHSTTIYNFRQTSNDLAVLDDSENVDAISLRENIPFVKNFAQIEMLLRARLTACSISVNSVAIVPLKKVCRKTFNLPSWRYLIRQIVQRNCPTIQ